MSPTACEPTPTPRELDALIRLLDDDTPGVRDSVAGRIRCFGGDLSEWLADREPPLAEAEATLLSAMLQPGRREALAREWQVPTGGLAALGEDRDLFEALLRLISDFLHDGITIRQPLSDALDLLAEEAEQDGVLTANDLRAFLFESGRLKGNGDRPLDPRHSDLAWTIAAGSSNPLGLGLVFMLVAWRLDLIVEGVNFPGRFLCRIHEDGVPLIVDCFDQGRLYEQAELLDNPELERDERERLRRAADAGAILIRLLNNLVAALDKVGRDEDSKLIRRLRASLR